MSEISSGLVAVAWMDYSCDPLVRLSDAEAIIAQKDAEIIEQCRINGMGAEREASLLGQIERQSAALKLASLALSEGVEYVEEPPEKNCSCHLAPPCNDCVEHSAVREFFIDARKAPRCNRRSAERRMKMEIEKRNGKRGVVIREDKYGIEVLTMRNGFQWSGMPMDAELIDMLEQAIVEFKRTQSSPASAPEGFALVPVVPTHAILDVMFNAGIDRHDGDLTLLYRAILAAAPTLSVSEGSWHPIETAPKETTQMFVVVAFGAKVGATPYNSDPWCVWHQRGEFVRWPHKFSPTHWMPLPEAPAMQEDKP